jgi:hypothetical protein
MLVFNIRRYNLVKKFLLLGIYISIITVIFVPPEYASAQSSEEQVVPGVIYHEYIDKEVPLSIQVIEVKRHAQGIEIGAALGGKYVLGIVPLDKIVEGLSVPGMEPVAAVNADFYMLARGPFQGDPTGLCVIDDEVFSSPVNRSVFFISDQGIPYIDRFKSEAVIKLDRNRKTGLSGINQSCPDNGIVVITPAFFNSTRPQKGSYQLIAGNLNEDLSPNNRYTFRVQSVMKNDSVLAVSESVIALVGRGEGAMFLKAAGIGDRIMLNLVYTPESVNYGGQIKHAVGGTPRLIRNGKISIENKEESVRDSFVTTRHPRTAAGYNDESIFLITVDGRRPGHSVGMSLMELADFMLELGIKEAVNLDGGGSTAMWVNGEIKNRPSDGNVRAIANALVVYSKKR